MGNEELHQYCEQWRIWCNTRKFFIVPGSDNILAQFQPSTSGEIPDADVCDRMSFFNMAIHALADMNKESAKCFVMYYCYRKRNIKAVAAEMKISRETFYARKMKFARDALSLSKSLKEMHDKSVRENPDKILVD